MKRFTLFSLSFLLFAFLFTFFAPQQAQACIDPDTTVTIHCDYDSNYTDIMITVSNIRLFTASPNQFCSCAVTSWTSIFSQIQYVAFVDSGTFNPIGFDPWTPSANATNAWESVLATGNWNGFVAQVAAGGALPGVPVDLIIRASLPPGYTFGMLDSALVISQLGSDEWDDTNQTLANSHQEIHGFWENGGPTYTEISPSSTFFEDVDNNILAALDPDWNQPPAVTLYPNPATDRVRIQLGEALHRYGEIELRDMQGRLIQALTPSSAVLEIETGKLNSGLYFLRVETDQGKVTRKLIIQ